MLFSPFFDILMSRNAYQPKETTMNKKMKHFDTFGVMIDMSRNAVMHLDGLKRFLTLLSKMGYNCVMLYTEDTYEIESEPFFGYMRGPSNCRVY